MKSLVLSVSPNTSTDRISVVENFVPGEPSRTLFSFDQAGGSGAHATDIAQQLGGDTRTLVLLGSYNRDRWKVIAEQHHMPYDFVDIGVPNRSTFVLIDKHKGNIAEVIDAGPQVPADTGQKLFTLIESYLDQTGLLILSGSLPPGMAPDFYVQAIELARSYQVKCLVDASAAPLQHALKARPWAIKPNLYEFHQIVGTKTTTIQEHIQQLSRISDTIADVILLSLGQDGLLVAIKDNIWHLTAPNHGVTLPDTSAINTIGCGDALVGGFSYGYVRGQDVVESACWGVACSTATLGTFGVPAIDPDQVRELFKRIQVAAVLEKS